MHQIMRIIKMTIELMSEIHKYRKKWLSAKIVNFRKQRFCKRFLTISVIVHAN